MKRYLLLVSTLLLALVISGCGSVDTSTTVKDLASDFMNDYWAADTNDITSYLADELTVDGLICTKSEFQAEYESYKIQMDPLKAAGLSIRVTYDATVTVSNSTAYASGDVVIVMTAGYQSDSVTVPTTLTFTKIGSRWLITAMTADYSQMISSQVPGSPAVSLIQSALGSIAAHK